MKWILSLTISIAVFLMAQTGSENLDLHEMDEIEQARIDLRLAFSTSTELRTLEKVLADSRLKLDSTVVRQNATTYRFNYSQAGFALLTAGSLDRGVYYYKKHLAAFKKAARHYNIDPGIILAILRIETNFGVNMGDRPVVNTLYSLYVLSPPRRSFAENELKNFLKISGENADNVFSIGGSTAGAFGIPQFLPSSYFRFAVDGDNDGKVDMFNHSDAILSVARYLFENGYRSANLSTHAKSVFSYNHSKSYVEGAMAYRSSIRKKIAVLEL